MLTYLTISTPLLFLSAVFLLIMAIYAWRHRGTLGAATLFWVLLAVSGWCFSRGMQQISATNEIGYIWYVIVYFFVAMVPVPFFLFAMEYTGREKWITVWRVALLLVVPATTQVIHVNDPALFLTDQNYQQIGPFLVINSQAQAWFWVHTAYSYGLIALGIGLIGVRAFSGPKLYRRQALTLLSGALVPLLANVPTTLNLADDLPTTLTELAFSVSAFTFGWALFRFQLLDVMPIARDLVIDSMADAVIVINDDGKVADINPAVEQMLNVERGEVVGQVMREAFAPWAPLIAAFADHDETEAVVSITIEGQLHHLEMSLTSLAQRNQRTAGRLVVLRDITERVRVEQDRQLLLRELDSYAHTVAHDLKSPLGSIIGRAQLVALKAPDAPQHVHDDLDEIVGGSRKMASIVDELLLLATVRKQADVKTKPLAMGTIIDEALDRLSHSIETAQAEVVTPDAWPAVMGYAPWVEEMWVNYLSNAIKYGGTPPRVEIGASTGADGTVRLWVKDNGPGLSVEEQAKLFVPFERLEQARADGHGLGLSIVQRIAERLGGDAGVESTIGEGSLFYFTLPKG